MYPQVLVATSVVTAIILLSHYTVADDVIIQKRVSDVTATNKQLSDITMDDVCVISPLIKDVTTESFSRCEGNFKHPFPTPPLSTSLSV
ncbi:hypothetical protein J6590_012816 [Homalodisca vitripennis]|nr:hypothetical protein J6590_012816 [Homalodisca vitripennis]